MDWDRSGVALADGVDVTVAWSAGLGGTVRICIAYATGEGQTAKIADYIADVVRAEGHDAVTVDIGHTKNVVPDASDGVIVGCSIHMGKHD